MGQLTISYQLEWVMELSDNGYTCHTLYEKSLTGYENRWGWLINVPDSGWLAHVGSFGVGWCPIQNRYVTVQSITEGKNWIEQTIADEYKKLD